MPSGRQGTAPRATRLQRTHTNGDTVSPPHFCIPSMGTARAPYHPEGDTPYLVPEADASRQGRRCPGGCHRHQWVTGSARGPGRRWWCGDSSAPCRHSMRPAGTGPTRHSCGFMMSPPNVPVSSSPPPRTWGMGQHPQVPFVVMQQVASSGHSDCPSGQGTARGAAESGNGVRDLHIPCLPPTRPTHVRPPPYLGT